VPDPEAGFAGGSVVRDLSFYKNLHMVQIFVKRLESFALPEAKCSARSVTA
jgi:hypothetical protein